MFSGGSMDGTNSRPTIIHPISSLLLLKRSQKETLTIGNTNESNDGPSDDPQNIFVVDQNSCDKYVDCPPLFISLALHHLSPHFGLFGWRG